MYVQLLWIVKFPVFSGWYIDKHVRGRQDWKLESCLLSLFSGNVLHYTVASQIYIHAASSNYIKTECSPLLNVFNVFCLPCIIKSSWLQGVPQSRCLCPCHVVNKLMHVVNWKHRLFDREKICRMQYQWKYVCGDVINIPCMLLYLIGGYVHVCMYAASKLPSVEELASVRVLLILSSPSLFHPHTACPPPPPPPPTHINPPPYNHVQPSADDH